MSRISELFTRLAIFVSIAICCDTSLSADGGDQPVITDPTAAVSNADYRLQGEYRGRILHDDVSGGIGEQRIGLQVVALGNDRFSAMQYPFGLPGDGWFGGDRSSLTGQRNDDGVQIVGDRLSVSIENDVATVSSSAGNILGRFCKVVRTSPSMGTRPPSGAIVLFDGTDTRHFKKAKMSNDGLLLMGTELNDSFRDFTMHIEFRLPFMPAARGQARGNSGLYLQSRYEVQILDSFGLTGEFNECGSLYRTRKPDVNMCFPPLTWQTYDLTFRAPRFDDCGNKCCNARLTVQHNGVAIHNDIAIERKTGAGKAEGPIPLPIKLQNHNNPIVFRNVWLVNHSQPACPPFAEIFHTVETLPPFPSTAQLPWMTLTEFSRRMSMDSLD